MSPGWIERLRDLIQEDVGGRGLRSDPEKNLLNACPDDLALAARSISTATNRRIGIITGFFIPHAKPPAGETDGPLGAIHLARALTPLGYEIVLISDPFCERALKVGLHQAGLEQVRCVILGGGLDIAKAEQIVDDLALGHLVSIERVGPNHTLASVQAQPGFDTSHLESFRAQNPVDAQDRLYTMRGLDVSSQMAPAHFLIEAAMQAPRKVVTIGIGDGGNEIGMGKIPWYVIERNIQRGGLIACRVATTHLIVCGISNWGAYALGAAVRKLRGVPHDPSLYSTSIEEKILKGMVEQGPLVDGIAGDPRATVDGLPFDRYVAPLVRMGKWEQQESMPDGDTSS